MKIRKNRLNSLLTRKCEYSIDYENEKELGENIIHIIDRFTKKFMYIKFFSKDEQILRFVNSKNYKRKITTGNFILIENPQKEVIENIFSDENIYSLRYISIYLSDEPISVDALGRIQERLDFFALYLSLDNYLENISLSIDPVYYEESLLESVLNRYLGY